MTDFFRYFPPEVFLKIGTHQNVKSCELIYFSNQKPTIIMNNTLDQLKNCADINALRAGLCSLCSRFGSIVRLDILTASQAGKRQALCFLRMDSPEEEEQVMSELGMGRFGGDLVVVIDLHNSGAIPL
jgi:hypothetical protein